MSGPLEGIRVLEVASWTFVPACAALLGDMGAEIIKVEPPWGDPQRGLRNQLNAALASPNPFVEIPNHGKRSIVLDLHTEGGHALLLRMAASCDVFLTSYLPHVCQSLRVGPEDIRQANPGIIYGRGSGWGSRGPQADAQAYDLAAAWAASGLANRFLSGDDGPISQPPAFFDLQASAWLAGAVAAALLKRERTGEPTVVDVALMNVAMWSASPDIVAARHDGTPWVRTRHHPDNPLSNWYRTSDDRWLYLVLLQTEQFWPALCKIVDRTDMVQDPRFCDPDARRANARECVRELDAVFGARPLAEWSERFEGFTGAWSPALTFREVRSHPQVAANDFLVVVEPDDGEPFELVGSPLRFDGAAPTPSGPAPELGQDTEMFLLELGLDWDEISAAREDGSLG